MFEKTLEICLSQTHASGNREAQTKRSFISSNVDFKYKDNSGQGMKGDHEEGTQKQKKGKVHFIALMASVTSISASTSEECSEEQSQV